jgi:aspartyl-tRNA(Asn)/glutamyl-tRNA(Gln) amidotransferase subunit A
MIIKSKTKKKEFYPTGLSETNLDAWNKSLEILSKKGECKLQSVSVPNAPYSMSCYSVLTSCEVASNFSRYDGLKYGYHTEINENYDLETVITKNRNESLGKVVKGRIVCGNYFLLEKY